MSGAMRETLLSVEDDLAAQARKLGFASVEEALAGPHERRLRWGDPIEVGDRVRLTLTFVTSTMHPIGYVTDKGAPVYGGVAATTAGTVRSLGDPLPFLAVVEWDDGYVQTLATGNLIQVGLLQSEAIRFHAGMLS